MIRESLSLAYEQQQLTKSANITCKRCSDRKFEESIMDSQFAAIYFQNIGIVFPGFWTIRPSLEGFYHSSELLPSRIFNQSRMLHQFTISFMTLATLYLQVICIQWLQSEFLNPDIFGICYMVF